ncbi:MAG: hypothetical protein HDT42_03155 [Ruminococcaceae bacterium]|nr:hypothetical protein [Oscillospiraceae bacterium]
MPNYEELYYIARGKYYQAVEERNAIRRTTAELQGRKNTLSRELGEKQTALSQIQQKKALIQDALNKCRNVLNNEFPLMKNDIQCISEEYKKIITSDKGVADLLTIYSADITNTNANLNSIVSDLERILREIEGQETTAQNDFASCNSELTTVTTQLNNVGNEAAVQRQINNYFTEMKEYELRWQNGE